MEVVAFVGRNKSWDSALGDVRRWAAHIFLGSLGPAILGDCQMPNVSNSPWVLCKPLARDGAHWDRKDIRGSPTFMVSSGMVVT